MYTRNAVERETIINFDETSKTATVYSASNQTLRQLENLSEAYPDSVRCVYTEPTNKISPRARKYEVPVSFIKFRGPRQMSERQREALEKARAKSNQNRL